MQQCIWIAFSPVPHSFRDMYLGKMVNERIWCQSRRYGVYFTKFIVLLAIAQTAETKPSWPKLYEKIVNNFFNNRLNGGSNSNF